MIFSHQFRMMAQEGHLASTSLLAGFQDLARINYDRPGSVYSAMFQLTTGFERMMKIVIILDHMVRNDLAVPTDKYLRSLGHSVTALYSTIRQAGQPLGVVDGWFDSETVHWHLLSSLSEFAKGSRYYNIDQLVSGHTDSDPLTRWFAVHMQVADAAISYKRQEAIMNRARQHCERLGLFGWEMGPKGQWDLTIDVTYQLEIARVTRGHVVWAIIEILKPLYRMIWRLEEAAHQIERIRGATQPIVPHMSEFFPFCLADRTAAVRRKAWTTLFYIAGRT